MKWVKRIAADFDVSAISAGGMVFQVCFTKNKKCSD